MGTLQDHLGLSRNSREFGLDFKPTQFPIFGKFLIFPGFGGNSKDFPQNLSKIFLFPQFFSIFFSNFSHFFSNFSLFFFQWETIFPGIPTLGSQRIIWNFPASQKGKILKIQEKKIPKFGILGQLRSTGASNFGDFGGKWDKKIGEKG